MVKGERVNGTVPQSIRTTKQTNKQTKKKSLSFNILYV